MMKLLSTFLDEEEVGAFREFLRSLPGREPPIFLRNELVQAFQKFEEGRGISGSLKSSWRFLRKIQELLHLEETFVLVHRHRKASCRIYRLDPENSALNLLTVKEFLSMKERLVKPGLPYDQRTMEINLAPFYDYGPSLKDPSTIGNGIKHLNRYMSSNLFSQAEKWNRALYEFLKLHQLHGVQLLLDGEKVRSTGELEAALEEVVDFLERCDCPHNQERIRKKMETMGFLAGWGNSLERILETINLLQDILEQPDEETLEEFLSRIPMVSKVALISPHGWFGQHNVLGRPDTGGQVVYVLDQARALEQYLAKDLTLAGLEIDPEILIVTRLIPDNEGTTSNQRLEPVENTRNVRILRVPFRDPGGEVVPHWISRFHVWPYLDQFVIDVEKELHRELGKRPDLLVGNYSDGNLVATQLSKNMGVIQCNIAHALEKSKYLFSDLYWENFENEYHFSLQFVADLISMNSANFIITSTSQEITGTDRAIGQYESYQFYTMPGLMHVTSGLDLFHPRFNVIPPGVNHEVYFPHTRKKLRRKGEGARLAKLLFEAEDPECLGRLDQTELPPVFSIARLDRIKNLTGLAEAFGRDERLRRLANLIIIASVLDPGLSGDGEEAGEIRKMHAIIEQYGLHGNIRWIGKRLSREETGEVYRIMADRQGIFVQPALFEAFGLTILEAMHSGLPVFATQFGGPLEIIEHEQSGFLVNPTDGPAMTARIGDFFDRCRQDRKYWQQISKGGMERAQSRFTWSLHCQRLTRLTKVYGFWRYSISQQAKSRLNQYLHLLYHLYFKERAKQI